MTMEIPLSEEDKKRIEAGIREKYARVGITPEGLFKYPSGRAGLEALHYDPDILRTLPPKALDSFCGVGNPFSLGPIAEGESVLDLGSGGGVDSMVAAGLVGPSGKVVGLDLSPEMVARARENLHETEFTQIEFRDFSGEKLPFPDERLDVVISNGVFNLIPEKAGMLKEVFRVLKPGGRLMIADQILTSELPPDTKSRVESWSG